MSERRARYVGHPDGADLTIEFMDGDTVPVHVAYGEELPAQLEDGRTIPAAIVDSLLEQEDNWTTTAGKTGKTAKDGE